LCNERGDSENDLFCFYIQLNSGEKNHPACTIDILIIFADKGLVTEAEGVVVMVGPINGQDGVAHHLKKNHHD
jgi:hypothetical protein